MTRKNILALAAGASLMGGVLDPAFAQQASSPEPMRVAYNERSNMGGGFIEFLFGGNAPPNYQPPMQRRNGMPPMDPQYGGYGGYGQQNAAVAAQPGFDPKFEKQVVSYDGREKPGTLVIDSSNKFLYLVQGDGQAIRYGIGVGREGFTWSGVKTISAKKEWPAWTPPPEMLQRRPDLPRHMEGGPENPLGARAMYLGSTLYRIHGSNEPWTIGTNVSSGCIRMRNEDVIDLYGRVNVGTKVIVL